jgi:hypothetical protein
MRQDEREANKNKLIDPAFIKYTTMQILYTKSFLLYAVASLTLYSAAVATECDNRFWDIINNDCTPASDSTVCPASCQTGFEELDIVCSADGMTLFNRPYDTTEAKLSALGIMDTDCHFAAGKAIIDQTANTCEAFEELYVMGAPIYCNRYYDCSFCRDIQDGVNYYCTADDTIMMKDKDTGKMVSNPVSTIVKEMESRLSSFDYACKYYGASSSSSSFSIPAVSVIFSLLVSSVYLFA